jgi:hypothetical protein
MKTRQERREERREKQKRMKISNRNGGILYAESQKKREEKYEVKNHNFED